MQPERPAPGDGPSPSARPTSELKQAQSQLVAVREARRPGPDGGRAWRTRSTTRSPSSPTTSPSSSATSARSASCSASTSEADDLHRRATGPS